MCELVLVGWFCAAVLNARQNVGRPEKKGKRAGHTHHLYRHKPLPPIRRKSIVLTVVSASIAAG